MDLPADCPSPGLECAADRISGKNKELNGMREIASVVLGLLCLTASAWAQTADELVAKNVQAKGGLEKIKAIKTLRIKGRLNQGSFTAVVGQELKRPAMLRSTFTVQGMTAIQAYDQDVWATTFDYAHRDPKQSLESFRAVREANIALLKALPRKSWENYGVHQERGNESLAHVVHMVAGHDLNHIQQVERIVKAKRRGRA